MAPRKRSKGKSPKPKQQAKTTRNRVVRAAPVVDDELEVFIPKSAEVSAASIGATNARLTGSPPSSPADDDVAVFVAQPGAPVQVQADWVDDDKSYADALAGLPEGHILTQLPDMTDLAELGFVRDVRAVNGARCKYDCGGAMSKVPNLAAHRYDCPYWRREGRAKTPF